MELRGTFYLHVRKKYLDKRIRKDTPHSTRTENIISRVKAQSSPLAF
jgi:hypothetical protein